jgi:uncharacterized protein involved in outer membrane biogenesis
VQNGRLQLEVQRLEAPDGALSGRFKLDSTVEPPAFALKMKVPRLNIKDVARNTKAQGLVQGDFSADIDLNGGGNTLNQWLASADGHVRVVMDKGQIDSALLNLYTGGTRAMVGMLVSTDAKTAKVNCGICGLNIKQGVASTEIAVLDTQYSTIVANGSVDLGKKTIDVKASPVAKGVTLTVAVPVTIEGPLTDPNVKTQKSSALVKAAEYFALFTVPTAAIFVAYDELRSGNKNPCVDLVKPSDDSIAKRAFKGLGKAVTDITTGFVKGLGNIFGFEYKLPGDKEQNQPEKTDQ